MPEPSNFDGTRSAKTLDHFLWDIDQYFKAKARLPKSRKSSKYPWWGCTLLAMPSFGGELGRPMMLGLVGLPSVSFGIARRGKSSLHWSLRATVTRSRINPLQLLGTRRAVKGSPSHSLLYVPLTLNGREVQAMVDTGATHNFATIARFGLSVGAHTSRVKAINSQAQAVAGRVPGE